jgi:hypothetical protein
MLKIEDSSEITILLVVYFSKNSKKLTSLMILIIDVLDINRDEMTIFNVISCLS